VAISLEGNANRADILRLIIELMEGSAAALEEVLMGRDILHHMNKVIDNSGQIGRAIAAFNGI